MKGDGAGDGKPFNRARKQPHTPGEREGGGERDRQTDSDRQTVRDR